MKVLITGARGFLGRNLSARLSVLPECEVRGFDLDNAMEELREWLGWADVVFHLAGINRPQHVEEFETGNVGFTQQICEMLRELDRTPKIVISSSIQAERDNPYGVSKRRAEEYLRAFADETGSDVRIYRLKNVFGKWCRPNYNSVVATFCNNIAHDLPISISDPATELELAYIDDVVDAFIAELYNEAGSGAPDESIPSYRIRLGELAGTIQSFHRMRSNLLTPDFASLLTRALYATYLSYVPDEERLQELTTKCDARGALAELIKSPHAGQVFVSRTRPGVVRGNHYHHTKTEKFFVVEGEAVIRMRQIEDKKITEYRVSGDRFQVIDIPPGHTHSIQNTGSGDMLVIFWASEMFDPDRPDTYYLEV